MIFLPECSFNVLQKTSLILKQPTTLLYWHGLIYKSNFTMAAFLAPVIELLHLYFFNLTLVCRNFLEFESRTQWKRQLNFFSYFNLLSKKKNPICLTSILNWSFGVTQAEWARKFIRVYNDGWLYSSCKGCFHVKPCSVPFYLPFIW